MIYRIVILLICFLFAGSASGQYPATGNKSRLGWQTTADGLIWRGSLADTTTIKPAGLNNAYFILDTVNAVLYRYIKTNGGWQEVCGGLTMPFDSVTFVTSYEGVADSGELIWNNQSGTLHLGMAGNIEMPLGQGEAHMVRNVTGSAIAKGKVVYISGATGQRPQISLADADAEMSSSGTFGITAEAIDNNDTGFVFTSGYIKGINTSALTEGEALWLDTTPGGFTHTKPTAPIHSVLVGYVITKKNNGTIFVKIQNGYELGELHNVNTQGVVAQDILRYNGTIWQPGKDTSLYNMDGTLKGNRLVSMGTADLQFRQVAGAPDYVQIKKDFVLVGNTNTGYNTVIDQYGIKQDEAGGNDAQIYLTSGEIALHGNQSVDGGLDPDLVVKPNGRIEFRVSAPGPVDSLFGKNSNGELTAVDFNFLSPVDTVSLSNRINLKLNISDTTAMLSPYLRKVDTLSLSNRINLKLNISDTSVFARDNQIQGAAGQVAYFNGTNSVTGNNNLFWDTSNNRLGIGTNTPTSLLHITGNYAGSTDDLAPQMKIQNLAVSSTASSFIKVYNSTGSLNGFPEIWMAAIGQNDANGSVELRGVSNHTMRFRTNDIEAGRITTSQEWSLPKIISSNFIRFNTLSNITNPTKSFEVQSPLNDFVQIGRPVATAGQWTGLGIGYFENGFTGYRKTAIAFESTGDVHTRGKLHILNNGQNNSSNASLSDARLTVDYTGNIGVGTRSPQKLLHVNGEVRISDLDNGTATKLVGATNDGDLDSISIGSGLTLSSGTLSATAPTIADGSITEAKLADGAAGGVKLGGLTYIVADDSDVDLTSYASNNWISAYSQLVVWQRIGNTASRKVTFPIPSSTYSGKVVEIFFGATNGATHYGYIESGGTNRITYRDGANVATTTTYNGGQVLTYAKVMCMQDPASGVYQWVVIDYNKY